jgi:phage portal protein BeeE
MAFDFITAFTDNLFDRGRYSNITRNLLPPSSQVWGKKEAVWLDTGDAWRLFVDIPELRTVINKRASMMSANVPKLYDKQKNLVENHWLNDLIKQPNAVQSWSDVVYSMSVQDALYSNVVAYCPKRSFDIRNLMVVLPNNKLKINLSGKKLKQMDKENLIDSFVFTYDDGTRETIDWIEAIYLTTADGMNIVKPISRIDSLRFPLSNIQAQYHKRNVLLENLGAIGILSASNLDMGGTIPMTPAEREKIQRDWYRRQKDEIMITESNLQWNPMSYPTRDLLLFEELSADLIAIIDTYGLNANLFSSEKGSTFSNVRDSMRMVYQDTIQPETQAMYDSIMHQMGLSQQGYYLEADFSHLPVLQDDEKQHAETNKIEVDTYSIMLKDGIITPEQYASEFDIEIQPIDRNQSQQAALAQAQTNLKGTVGGLDGIIALNRSVGIGEMDRQTAVNTLISYYGYDPTVANSLITQPKEVITPVTV